MTDLTASTLREKRFLSSRTADLTECVSLMRMGIVEAQGELAVQTALSGDTAVIGERVRVWAPLCFSLPPSSLSLTAPSSLSLTAPLLTVPLLSVSHCPSAARESERIADRLNVLVSEYEELWSHSQQQVSVCLCECVCA